MTRKIKDKTFDIGQVIRYAPPYSEADWGHGVVVDTDGSFFQCYWDALDEVRKHDIRGWRNMYIPLDTPLRIDVVEQIMRGRRA